VAIGAASVRDGSPTDRLQTPVEGATLADIDPAAARRFLQVARTERQWDVRADTPVKQVLRQVGLLVATA
jgi:hypothetical protein